MINQFTTLPIAYTVGSKMRNSASLLLLLGVVLLGLSACAESEPSGIIKSNSNGGVEFDFSPPEMLLTSRAVDSSALSVDVLVNGTRVQLDSEGDQWIGNTTVSRGDSLSIVATWLESYEGGLLELAEADQDYTVPVNPDSEILVHFLASDYFTGFDRDSDGISNLSERNAGTDPIIPEAFADDIILVPVTFRGELPDQIREANSDILESLFAVAEIDRNSIVLSREGEDWVGETTFPTNTDVLINFTVYSSANRDVPIAKWQGTRNVGSGAALSVASNEYSYNEFNSDGDDVNNIQEVINGTNPLDKSDPAPIQPCDISQFAEGCDIDSDGDGDPDSVETETADDDSDSIPNYLEASDQDDDRDGLFAEQDRDDTNACEPSTSNDVCQASLPADSDGDGVIDDNDNCRNVGNSNQADDDGDGVGNACDTVEVVEAPDRDGDGFADSEDNCPDVSNPSQSDDDGDNVGNACDTVEVVEAPDRDGDGFADSEDNCPDVSNSSQSDDDGDNVGNACDTVEVVEAPDRDGDGFADSEDNCPDVSNSSQSDDDGDNVGNACDTVEVVDDEEDEDEDEDEAPDRDGDGFTDSTDNCLSISNPGQEDADENNVGDACETSLLNYQRFNDRWTELPDFSSLTPVDTGTAATFSLQQDNGRPFYGLRFTGRLNVVVTGDYTFYTASNDGSKLYIDGSLVVDNDGLHTLREESGTASLSAGLHDITLDYFQSGGTEELTVSWAGGDFSKQTISDEVLFSP